MCAIIRGMDVEFAFAIKIKYVHGSDGDGYRPRTNTARTRKIISIETWCMICWPHICENTSRRCTSIARIFDIFANRQNAHVIAHNQFAMVNTSTIDVSYVSVATWCCIPIKWTIAKWQILIQRLRPHHTMTLNKTRIVSKWKHIFDGCPPPKKKLYIKDNKYDGGPTPKK